MNSILQLVKLTLGLIPAILLFRGYKKLNLKKEKRSSQLIMPLVALLYTIVAMILINQLMQLSELVLTAISKGLDFLGKKLEPSSVNILKTIGKGFTSAATALLRSAMSKALVAIAPTMNFVILAIYMVIKRIVLLISAKVFVDGNALFDRITPKFYELNEHNGIWYEREDTVHAKAFLRTVHTASIIISMILMYISFTLYVNNIAKTIFFAVFGILIIGEMFFYIDGITQEEAKVEVSASADNARSIYNFISMRQVLRRLFGDKICAEDTTINTNILSSESAEALIAEYESSPDFEIELYAKALKKYRKGGKSLDANYITSGLELLKNNSILFNSPFYYDLIPYVFYAINQKLLNHRKVLIVLGRHGIEDDIIKWCEDGLRAVSNTGGMWRIGMLKENEQDLEIGIISRSDVQNLKLHKANTEFFAGTEFVVIIEPSKLITTAQIGLNSLIRCCRQKADKQITFCITDKNCDGLLDAISHTVMTSLTEVSPTETHEGVCSYVSWKSDGDFLQHRMLPNIARYLGIGTELSFAAIKNQILNTKWYGGDAFPVVDMHWVAKQYYADLLRYSSLPTSQPLFDEVFSASANLWNAEKDDKAYITVEDESNNLFEAKRNFATRAIEQNFINIISTPYLLYDYMTYNKEIFNADSKAIPYISADYVSTKRNVLFRIFVQMASGYMWESDIVKELSLINISTDNIADTLWKELCSTCNSIENVSEGVLTTDDAVFEENVIVCRQRYNLAREGVENAYEIADPDFISEAISDLSSAKYVAEDNMTDSYIGSELKGQIFQKYLPGQMLTVAGKYYEMVSSTMDNQIVLRRAADHIDGRYVYRQERNYFIRALREDTSIGSDKIINGMRISRIYADLSVDTVGYWKMNAYNNFAEAKHVIINNVPQRKYNNKWILQLDFKGMFSDQTEKVRYTLTNLLNEVFRSLFADNQSYIIATTKGEAGVPQTYGLDGNENCVNDTSIYIIEDSQYDMGLLVAVERNIDRIFNIVCDYLEWNEETIEASRNGSDKVAPDYRVYEELPEEVIEEVTKEEENDKTFIDKAKGIIKNVLDKLKKPKDEAEPAEKAEEPEGEPAAQESEGEAAEDPETETAEETEKPEEEATTEEPAESEGETDTKEQGEEVTD